MSLGTGVICAMPKSRYIRNVEGSSEDPKIEGYNDWIQIWTDATDSSSGLRCCLCGCNDGMGRQEIIGGHIVLGTDSAVGASAAASKWRRGLHGGSRVFIAPICKNCNGQSGDLWVQEDTTIVQLCGFMLDMTGADVLNQFAGTSDLEGKEWDAAYEEVEREHRNKMQRILNTQSRAGLNKWDRGYLKRSRITKKSISSLPANFSGFSGGSGPSGKAAGTSGSRYDYSRSGFVWGFDE